MFELVLILLIGLNYRKMIKFIKANKKVIITITLTFVFTLMINNFAPFLSSIKDKAILPTTNAECIKSIQELDSVQNQAISERATKRYVDSRFTQVDDKLDIVIELVKK